MESIQNPGTVVAWCGFALGLVLNILQATLPQSLQGHTTMFAFLGVIAILVLLGPQIGSIFSSVTGSI